MNGSRFGIVFFMLIVMISRIISSSRNRKKTAEKRARGTTGNTASRQALDRRFNEGKQRQRGRNDHSQVFGHSADDHECDNEPGEVRRYSTTYVNDGRDPWDQKREKDPWEL